MHKHYSALWTVIRPKDPDAYPTNSSDSCLSIKPKDHTVHWEDCSIVHRCADQAGKGVAELGDTDRTSRLIRARPAEGGFWYRPDSAMQLSRSLTSSSTQCGILIERRGVNIAIGRHLHATCYCKKDERLQVDSTAKGSTESSVCSYTESASATYRLRATYRLKAFALSSPKLEHKLVDGVHDRCIGHHSQEMWSQTPIERCHPFFAED